MISIIRITIMTALLVFNTISVKANYASLVTKPNFMDKTMMVKSFLDNNNKCILVSAPHFSGRTTNLLMLKHFFEISVDEDGEKEMENTTSNYKLFKENELNIFEHKDIVNNYFGKYPVIHIKCRTLGNIFNYRELVTEFREIVRDVFSQHKYLLLHKKLWTDPSEVDHFKDFFIGKKTKRLNPYDMIKGFTYMAEILKLRFGKPAILLLDDYDIITEKLGLGVISDTEQITKFLKTLYTSLLQNNKFIHKALVTGVFKDVENIDSETDHSILPSDIVKYDYMDEIHLCKFFRHIYT